MAKTLIDIDEDLLKEAAVALNTSTKKETVTVALRQAVAVSREERRAAREYLQGLAASGELDFDKLDELDQ